MYAPRPYGHPLPEQHGTDLCVTVTLELNGIRCLTSPCSRLLDVIAFLSLSGAPAQTRTAFPPQGTSAFSGYAPPPSGLPAIPSATTSVSAGPFTQVGPVRLPYFPSAPLPAPPPRAPPPPAGVTVPTRRTSTRTRSAPDIEYIVDLTADAARPPLPKPTLNAAGEPVLVCPVPLCGFVQANANRTVDMERHMNTHFPESHPCIGLPVDMFSQDLFRELPPELKKIYLVGDVNYVGGCGGNFTRADSLKRHLNKSQCPSKKYCAKVIGGDEDDEYDEDDDDGDDEDDYLV